MRRGILAVVATAASISAASAQAQQLFGGFEGNLNGSLSTGTAFQLRNGINALNPPASLQYTATGATQGATSLRLRLPTAFVFGLEYTEGGGVTALKDVFDQNDRLLFDVTIPQINDASGAPDGDGFVVFLAAINSDGTGGGFRQSGNLLRTDGGGENAYNAGTVTFAFNYRDLNLLFPADSAQPNGFTQFNLAFNAGNLDSAPVAFIDNFRFVPVPEPTTLAAVAALGSVLLRRRR